MSFLSQFALCSELILFFIAFSNDSAPLRALRLVIDTPDNKNEVHFVDAFYSNVAQSVDFVVAARISLQSPRV